FRGAEWHAVRRAGNAAEGAGGHSARPASASENAEHGHRAAVRHGKRAHPANRQRAARDRKAGATSRTRTPVISSFATKCPRDRRGGAARLRLLAGANGSKHEGRRTRLSWV